MEIKTLDQKGLDFLTLKEGLILVPYLDTKKIPTIGIGMTYYPDTGNRVTMSDPAITRERAQDMFRAILTHYETAVWSVTRDDINQNQFNALVSFCYNIGTGGFKSSTVVTRVNKNPNDPKIADAFLMWKKPKEIIGRRLTEVELYFRG